MAETEHLEKLVKECLVKLGEHAASVRIFVTKDNEDESAITEAHDAGTGNFYAQYGQVREWLIKMDRLAIIEASKGEEEE